MKKKVKLTFEEWLLYLNCSKKFKKMIDKGKFELNKVVKKFK